MSYMMELLVILLANANDAPKVAADNGTIQQRQQ
jgi:hypothetical protein